MAINRDLVDPAELTSQVRVALAEQDINGANTLAPYLPSETLDDIEFEAGSFGVRGAGEGVKTLTIGEVALATFAAHDLPDGVDTIIGEEGLSLSGGQRQRLALARAVAARPAVLVLDDPLSALDVDTEALVEDALREVMADTTTLVIAHRPSTVTLADRVALLEEGRVTAVGRHSDLLRESEHYRHVISSFEEAENEASDRRASAGETDREHANEEVAR